MKLTWWIVAKLVVVVGALDIRWCHQPMGMHSGKIPDSALSASSSFDIPSVGPQHARLGIDRNGGAWCPKQAIARDVVEFLEIDLNQTVVISGIATQGRYGNGRGQEYAEAYRLEFWRPQLNRWLGYKRRHLGQTEILEGNSDTWTSVHHDLRPIVVANKLRIIPHGIHPRTVCMRVELYGCLWNESLSSYSIPAGHEWSDGFTLDDRSYDGTLEDGRWIAGLGMLTDGQYGSDEFKLSPRKDCGWIGWNNDSTSTQPLELIFEFDSVQNFTAVKFHVANYFSVNVQVFERVRLRFSGGGRIYSGKSVTYVYMRDSFVESGRNISVHIPHLCGRFVKIQLYFASRWILLSEITFQSNKAQPTGGDEFLEDAVDDRLTDDQDVGMSSVSESETHLDGFNTESANQSSLFEALVGALSAIMLLLIIVIVVIIFMNHRRKNLQDSLVTFDSPLVGTSHLKNSGVSAAIHVPIDAADDGIRRNSDGEIASETNSDPAIQINPTLLNSKIPTNPARPIPSKSDLQSSPDPGYASLTRIRLNPIDFQNGSFNRSTFSSSLRLAVPKEGAFRSSNLNFPRVGTDPISRRSLKTINTPVNWSWNIQPVNETGILMTDSSTLMKTNHREDRVPEIPRHSLRLVEWLGSSSIGEAYLCHLIENEEEQYENGSNLVGNSRHWSKGEPLLVRSGRLFKDDQELWQEIRMLSSIRHRHLCPLLAYSFSDANIWMIFQCPIYGDLNTYLKQLPESIDDVTVMKLSIQIAKACQYLETKGLVHKDLATRNCLLGPELQIKVADLAVVCATFQADYGEVRGRRYLPIRWLPWENLVLGKFGEYSQVWMLAVTVWEVSISCRDRPYDHLSDAQVILNADHFYYSDGREVVLQAPPDRPVQLYQWMTSCWVRHENQRPTLTETMAFLTQLYQNATNAI